MNIIRLKDDIFSEITNSLSFIQTKGFVEKNCLYGKTFGSNVYFYSDDEEWVVTTPECRIINADVNTFQKEYHKIMVDYPKKFYTPILKNAAKIAYDNNLLQKSCEVFTSFEDFWKVCRVPNMLSIEKESYSKRGKSPQYINIFFKQKELTGNITLGKNDIIQLSFKWVLTETIMDDRIHIGFRPHFAGGIQIIKRYGLPKPIKTPWSWLDVCFETMSMPMYSSIVIKWPVLNITAVQGNKITVCTKNNQDFNQAMKDFHALALAEDWNKEVILPRNHRARVGERLMTSAIPTQNNTIVFWSADKYRILPAKANPRVEAVEAEAVEAEAVEAEEAVEADQVPTDVVKTGAKRHAGSMDNFFGIETKRQCILNETYDHKIK
jgi:hypothetical protein